MIDIWSGKKKIFFQKSYCYLYLVTTPRITIELLITHSIVQETTPLVIGA